MNVHEPDGAPTWQAVALELLRRRAGAEPRMTAAQLRDAGDRHVSALVRKRIDSLYFVACEVNHPRQRLYQALWDVQVREARRIIAAICELGVEPVVIKGVEVGARYDRHAAVGERADIDLLVGCDELWKVKNVLYGHGYMQGHYQRETRTWVPVEHLQQLRHETAGYELWPFRRAFAVTELDDAVVDEARRNANFCVEDDVVLAFVKFDVHHNVLFDFDVLPLFERSIPGGLGVGRALCPADHLWFSIVRYYFEVATGRKRALRGLAWIAPMVRDPDVDWSLLVRTAIDHRATAPCWYWLTLFRQLGARTIPDTVLHELAAHHGDSHRNWGWQFERLLELEPEFPARLLAAASG